MQEIGGVLAARGMVDGARVAALVGEAREMDGPGVDARVESKLAVLDLKLAVGLPGAHGHGADGPFGHLAPGEFTARGDLPGFVKLDERPHFEVGPLAGELASGKAARVLGVIDQPDLHTAFARLRDGGFDHFPPAVGEVFIREIVARLDVDDPGVDALHQVQVLLDDLGVHRAFPSPEDVAGVFDRRRGIGLLEGRDVGMLDAFPAADRLRGEGAAKQGKAATEEVVTCHNYWVY